MPVVNKKPGDQFTLTATVKNVGDVTINLGIAVVLSGPKTYSLSIKDIGNLAPGQQYPLYYVEYIRTEFLIGTYDVLVAAIDRNTNQEFQRIDTTWDINIVSAVKKIELSSVSVS
jgi:nucleoside-triphosphatase THEP1